MDFRAFFKHMETSLPLYAYAEDKIKRTLEKHPIGVVSAAMTFSVERRINKAECHVTSTVHRIDVTATDELSMYAAVDRLVDRLDAQLSRFQGKARSHRGANVVEIAPRLKNEDPELGPGAIDAAEILSFEAAKARSR